MVIEAQRPAVGSSRPARILLVDDDNAAVLLTRIALEESSLHAELVTAGGVREAMKCLADSAPPDLVLLDLNLRDGSGHDILAAMKQDSALAAIPVVILSTSSSPTDIDLARERGADRYLVKPTEFDEFIHAIDQLQDFLQPA